MPIRSRILKVLPILQRVPESNLESASGDSFRDASTSHDFNSEPTSSTLEATYTSGTDPLNNNNEEEDDDDYDDNDNDNDIDHTQQQQERQSQGENEARPPVHPRNSLDQLSQLPNFVGLSNSTSTSNSMCNSLTSTGSRPSHSSMPSISSMPSLSSIVDQDLISIGTLSLADSATTSSMGPPTFPPIQVKLTPPLDDPSFVDHQRMVRQVHVDLARQTMMKTPSSRIRPPSTAFSSSPKQQEQKEWESLQGTTLDVLEGNVFKPTQKVNPTNRWQIGNPNIAPLTHTQKLLLPRRGDVQPRLVSRQESDLSMS